MHFKGLIFFFFWFFLHFPENRGGVRPECKKCYTFFFKWRLPLLMHLHFKPMTMTNYDWVNKPVFSKTMNHKKLNIISLILICRINKVAKYLTKSAARNNECLLISRRRCDTMRGGGIQHQPGRGCQSDSWLTQSPAGCITVKTWKPTRCCY